MEGAGSPGHGIGVEATVAEVAKLWGSAVPSGKSAPRTTGQGFHGGEAIPPVPARLVERIHNWEFIEMGELRPEFWIQKEDGKKESQRGGSGSKGG